MHQIKTGNDLIDSPGLLLFWCGLYAFSYGNLIVFRLTKPFFMFSQYQFTIDRIERESDDVVSLHIGGRDMDKFHFQPGQFIMARFLARGFTLESHPFSLSLPPGQGKIRISIKNSGDFTARISGLSPGTRVIIDGPHGVFTPAMCSREKLLLVAGGIGITPLRSIAEVFIKDGREVTLLYSTRKKGGIVFREELDALAAHKNFSLHHVVSDDPSWEGEKGRIDQEKIARLVPDPGEREVYVCGPPPMMMGLVKILISMGVHRDFIHFERFSL